MASAPVPVPEPAAAAASPDALTRQLADLRTTAAEHWRRGDVNSALSTIQSALSLEPRDTSTNALVEAFLIQARERSSNAAAIARSAGVENSGTASLARARESEAIRLVRAKRTVQAVQAHLDAASLFLKATSESGATSATLPPVAPPADPPQRPAEPSPPVQAAPPPPPQPESRPAAEPQPAPPTRTENTPPRAEAARPPQPPAPTAPTAQNEESAIRETLQRYRAAYEGLSPDAVKTVYPAINVAALAGVFKEYRSLKMTIDIEKVQIDQDGRTATVTASVTNIPVVKVGKATTQQRKATYTLRKTGASWLIEMTR